jgi:putative ABC transport system permease protein
MLKNYFTTAIRFLRKNKTFSVINIFGLTAGTLCCLYIVLYVQDQFGYDRQHQDADNIYRVITTLRPGGLDPFTNATCSPPVAPALKKDFPPVSQFTRVINTGMLGIRETLLRYKDKSFYEKDVLYVDSTFFDVFTYHFVAGAPEGVLNDPYSVVLLQPTAVRLFGNEDPVGKTIELDNVFGKHAFRVGGVVDERLGKTHLHGNLFLTMNSGGIGDVARQSNTWAGGNFTYSYIRLRPNTDVAALEMKLPAFVQQYGAEQMKQVGLTEQLHLQPLRTIHTTPGYVAEMTKTVSPSFLKILLLIAILTQVVACINFMNLSTARASKRAKEVGVRKVVGASRGQLVWQFIGESFLLSMLAICIALPLLSISLPVLNRLTGSDIRLSFSAYPVWILLAGVVLLTGLLAGSYPAFYLSAFRAVKVIKGNFTNHISAAGIRRALVVFQFVLSVVLISGIVVIYSQLDYMKYKDLGFDTEQRLVLDFNTNDSKAKMPILAADYRQLAEVSAVSMANNYLSAFIGHDLGIYPPGGDAANAIHAQDITTDEHFVKANGIRIISGRDFHPHDSGKVLINETLASQLGLDPAKAPGTFLYQQGGGPAGHLEIAGVMKNFNFSSLHEDIRPFMLVYDPGQYDIMTMTVAVSSKDYPHLLAILAAIWKKDLPGVPFDYAFLDDEVQKQYDAEFTISRIIDSFTLMAVIISSLGLFGLSAFSAEQRKKEIGVRKVLGAGVAGIARLLSMGFLRLVVIAILLAVPLSWWAMNKWLQEFAYRVELRWWMFALSGVIAIVIAMLTVVFQSVRAAVTNPVEALRGE